MHVKKLGPLKTFTDEMLNCYNRLDNVGCYFRISQCPIYGNTAVYENRPSCEQAYLAFLVFTMEFLLVCFFFFVLFSFFV